MIMPNFIKKNYDIYNNFYSLKIEDKTYKKSLIPDFN